MRRTFRFGSRGHPRTWRSLPSRLSPVAACAANAPTETPIPDPSDLFDADGNPTDPYAEGIDPRVSCDDCRALCCRLTVLLVPGDRVPAHMIERTQRGDEQMARGEDGWCVAIDAQRMRCGIYEQRPSACRRFAMGGPYCRAEREDYYERGTKDIPFKLRC